MARLEFSLLSNHGMLNVSQSALATLISATKPPSGSSQGAILSPEGRKRYFVVHGGLFSKDGVTLDDIRKVQRIGHQPGQEGLMCEFLSVISSFSGAVVLTHVYHV